MAKEIMNERAYTVREAGIILNLSQVWLRQCIREGRIAAYRPTGPLSNYRIPEAEIERLTGRTDYNREILKIL